MIEDITEDLERAEFELERARKEANRLAVLNDFLDHWGDFIINQVNRHLHDNYGSGYEAGEITMSRGFRNEQIADRIEIHFNFTSDDLPEYGRFDFRDNVIDPVINEITPHPHIDLFTNTNWVDKGYYVLNVQPKDYENYEY